MNVQELYDELKGMIYLSAAIKAQCPWILRNHAPDANGDYQWDMLLEPGMIIDAVSNDVRVTVLDTQSLTIDAPGWFVRENGGAR